MPDSVAFEASERIRKRRDAILRVLQDSWTSSQDSLPPDEEEDLAEMLLVLSSAYGNELPRRVQLLCGVMSCLKDNALQDIAAVARGTILPTSEDVVDSGSLGEKVERKCSKQEDIVSMLHSTTYNDETKSSGEPSDGVLSQKRRQHGSEGRVAKYTRRDRNWEQDIEDAASLIESRQSCKAATIIDFMEVLNVNVKNWELADEDRHDGETPQESLGTKVFDMAADDSLGILSQQVFSETASPEKEKRCPSPTVYDMAHDDDEEEILEELDEGSDDDSLHELIHNTTEQAGVFHSEIMTGGKLQVCDGIEEVCEPTAVAALAVPAVSRTASPSIADSAALARSDSSSIDFQETLGEQEGLQPAKQDVHPEVVVATREDLQLAGSKAAVSESAVPEAPHFQGESPKSEAVAALEVAAPEAMAPGPSHIQDSSLESSHGGENITDEFCDILQSRDTGDLMITRPCEDMPFVKSELPVELELAQDLSVAARVADADEEHAPEAAMLESLSAIEIPCQAAALGVAEQSEPNCQGAAERDKALVAACVEHVQKPDEINKSEAVMLDIVSEEKVTPGEDPRMVAPEAATSEAAAPAGDASEAAMIETASEEKVASGAAALKTGEQQLSKIEGAAWRHMPSVGTWHGGLHVKLEYVKKPDIFEKAPAECDQTFCDETTPTTVDATDSQTLCDEATPTTADAINSLEEACKSAMVTTSGEQVAAVATDEHCLSPWLRQMRSNSPEGSSVMPDEKPSAVKDEEFEDGKNDEEVGSIAAAQLAACVREGAQDEHCLQPWLLKLRQSSSKGSSVAPDVKHSQVQDREFEASEEDEEEDSMSDDESNTEETDEDRQVRLRVAEQSRERIKELARELHSMLSSSAASSSLPLSHLGSTSKRKNKSVGEMVPDTPHSEMIPDTPHSNRECDRELPLVSHRSSGMLRPSGAAILVKYLPCK